MLLRGWSELSNGLWRGSRDVTVEIVHDTLECTICIHNTLEATSDPLPCSALTDDARLFHNCANIPPTSGPACLAVRGLLPPSHVCTLHLGRVSASPISILVSSLPSRPSSPLLKRHRHIRPALPRILLIHNIMPTRHLPRPEVVLTREALGIHLGLARVGGARLLHSLGDEGCQLQNYNCQSEYRTVALPAEWKVLRSHIPQRSSSRAPDTHMS